MERFDWGSLTSSSLKLVSLGKIVEETGSPLEYHVIKDMTHYAIYGRRQADILKMELDWFDKFLKNGDSPTR